MNTAQAERAINEGKTVARFRPGRPDKPYIGKLIEASHGELLFRGISGTEEIEGWVRPSEVFFLEGESKK